MGLRKTYKFLGLQIGSGGCSVTGLETQLYNWLQRVEASPLSPAQKLYALKVHVLPALMHQMVLGEMRCKWLDKWDRRIRNFARKIAHLPRDTVLGAFYGSVSEGGMGIMCLRSRIPYLRENRMADLKKSEYAPIVYLRGTRTGEADLERIPLARDKTLDVKIVDKIRESEYWKTRLHESVDGAGLKGMAHAPGSSAWVADPLMNIRGTEWVRALHVRLAILKTPLRASRGRQVARAYCSSCSDKLKSLSHISQTCSRTHGPRVLRHDNLVKKIKLSCERKKWKVHLEPRIKLGSTFCKPDLVIIRENDIWVVDPTIVSDTATGFDPAESEAAKVGKYLQPEVLEGVGRLPGAEGKPVTVNGLAMTWRGGLTSKGWHILKSLGISKSYVNYMVVGLLNDTWWMWMGDSRRTDTGFNA